MYNKNALTLLSKALAVLSDGFDELPPFEETKNLQVEKVLMLVAEKMKNNFPYFHPYYAGQMLKPPHEIARLAYMLSMWINPNNHALDGGRASSQLEKEAVREMAGMIGWKRHLGHLTSGGTFANLEALWIAGQLHPGKKIAASELAHYTHERISQVLKLPFTKIACDENGTMDLHKLEKLLKRGTIGTLVVTMGTTGIGTVDPLPEIIALQKKYTFRIHLDAAYGGYFRLADQLSLSTMRKFALMQKADSIVIDPHKHGLQPYGCGCILFKDTTVGKFYKHQSPYTYFSSKNLHLGEISLECSRAGAAAVSLWATQKIFPLSRKGEFSKRLNDSHKAAMKLYEMINAHPGFIALQRPELDIVIWAPLEKSLSAMSRSSKNIFKKAAKKNIHLAMLNYPAKLLPKHWKNIICDDSQVTCLRSCLMKPEHVDWIDEIWRMVVSCL
ncbi:MAG: aspartate aminotransferase family protein [Bacteroidetes bacterium]|nr:aspartate aminotransferase family protein [Bacteroidota bacterium]